MLAMKESRSNRLQPVAKLAKNEETKATEDLAFAQQQLAEAETKLTELKSYREEYLIDFNARAQRGVTGIQIAQYQQFLGKLDDALLQQDQIVVKAKTQLEQTKCKWQKKRSRVQALDTVIDQSLLDEQRQRDKIEQNQQDEISSQRHLRDKKID
jgi:flagellar protein FliJ